MRRQELSSLLIISLGFLSLLLGRSDFRPLKATNLETIRLQPQWQSAWIIRLSAADPEAEAIVQQYIDSLSGGGLSTSDQGVWVQTGNYPIAKHQQSRPLSAASLTKIATTLAALTTWGPDYQFETLVGSSGPLENGVLRGNLVVKGSGDPFFVWEEAISLGNALQQLGIQQIKGNLVIIGEFAMNFETDPIKAGELLRQGLNAQLWPPEAWTQYGTLPINTAQPKIQISGSIIVQPPETIGQVSTWLIRHQSLSLAALLKAMNIYSNNAMSEMMAAQVGGPRAVMSKAIELADVPPSEIRLINGSGLGEENQISPRAVVKMLVALQRSLKPHGLNVADLLPVAGQDLGTLIYRQLPTHAALKTGSLAQVSSLAGVFPTRDRGLVWFSIINRGGDIEGLRAKQDKLLNTLQQHWGAASSLPTGLTPTLRLNQGPHRLGEPKRNQKFRNEGKRVEG
ncbi:MAG: D-alanyl-D-alanine carboxypeptidase [Pseudanabaenales cyanobacterium]|nr:D-alanyl-D-alanine carboxypeptidase [Pseudanabaenales cyanobacterium]